MLRSTSHRRISEMLGNLLGIPASRLTTTHTRKQAGSRNARRGRALSAEQLESRQLLTGLAFESVITTESNFPVGDSSAFAVAADVAGNTYMGGLFTGTADFDRNAVHSGNEDILTARGSGDAFVAKYDPSGQFLWARRMGGDSTLISDDTGYGIATDNSGNVFLTGNFGATADFGGSSLTSVGKRDSYVAKLDPNGNFLWTREFGTEVDEHTTQVVVDDNGSVTVATLSSTVGQATTRIRQFDTNGTQLWVYQVAANGYELRRDASGDLYVAGRFRGTVDLDPGLGEYLVTGASSTTNNSFISKISNSGEFQWATTLVSDPSIDAASTTMVGSIAVGNDGSIAITGSYTGQVRIEQGNSAFSLPSAQTSRAYFATLDRSTGALQVVKVYEGNFLSRSLIATDSGYAATGMTDGTAFNPVPGISLTGWGSNDVWLMTLDNTGSVLWAGLVGGDSIDVAYQLKSDGNGGLLLPGNSASTVFDFDPSPLRSNAVSSVASFVLKLRPMLATKFYVVDDASNNRTYEYAADHSSVENYWLSSSGSMTPRGAASTVVGDKVWVVDANKKVYVYNDSGILLGSWTAGSVASNATIEGIATNGTDVWLVDARQDRVYRYANAASRLSGSQNATSNFALNSGNTSPKDIVTDGTNLWVVNDSSTDRVFKYTLTGSLVGSWTIDSGNKAPTGLTIDPSGASQSIWIVDNGTDRVYEYTNSRSRNSSSQTAALSFALASGNTNPQGIADPPAPASAGLTSGASTLDKSNGNKITSDKNGLNVQMLEGSFPTVSSDSRDSKLARRFDPPREAISNGMVRDTAAVDSSTYVVPFFSSRSASPTASLAAIDEAFSSPDSLLDDDQHESLWSLGKTSIKGRRLR